jgi:hypothetical protein
MTNAVFWDIKAQFVLHRRHITSLLQSPASWCCVRFEVFTAVTMKNVVFLGYRNPVRTSQETRLHYSAQPVNATVVGRWELQILIGNGPEGAVRRVGGREWFIVFLCLRFCQKIHKKFVIVNRSFVCRLSYWICGLFSEYVTAMNGAALRLGRWQFFLQTVAILRNIILNFSRDTGPPT